MSDTIYHTLQEILDTIPNGFPKTEEGIEIDILKKIYTEEEAELTTKLKLKFETVERIAERTGLDQEYLKKKLKEMWDNGQIFGAYINGIYLYKLLPFVFGIYEFQIDRMDKELAELIDRYFSMGFGDHFHTHQPSLMKVIPIEKEIPSTVEIQPYESLTELINNAQAWAVHDCVCKKEKHLLGKGCDYPLEVCIGLAPIPNYFEEFFWGKPITKEKALEILDKAEEAGLVHMTGNQQNGHGYICNCCGCCCGMLRGITEFGYTDSIAQSNYIAAIDEELCTACGICTERCQVDAIEIEATAIINEKCIGCGLCVSTCPTEAISLNKRDDSDILNVPVDEKEWMKERGKARGSDDYKKLIR